MDSQAVRRPRLPVCRCGIWPMWQVDAGNGINYDDVEVDNYKGRSNPRVQIQPFCPRRVIVMLSRVQIRPFCPRGLNHDVSQFEILVLFSTFLTT